VFISSNGLDIPLVVVWLVILASLLGGIVLAARRRGWSDFLKASARTITRRRLALSISLVAVIGTMVFSMVDFSLLHGVGEWYEAGFNDFWRAWSTSYLMTFSGGYGHVYTLDSALETAPAALVFIAPISRLAFGLSSPYPGAVLYPTAFWVAGPLFIASIAFPLCAAEHWIERLGVTDIRRKIVVLGAMAITLPPIALFGHPEDAIALGAVLYGLAAALDGRSRAAGIWIGVALAFQFLAFFAIPIAFVLIKRRQWLTALIPMVLLPLVFLVVPLVTAPSATVHQIIHQKVFYDLGFISPTWNLDPGVGAFIRLLIALAAVPAALVLRKLLPESKIPAGNSVLWVLGLLFMLRAAEPELVPYFLAPALALMALSAARAAWWRLGATAALAVWLNWWLHVPIEARWSYWILLLAQLAVLAWLSFPTPEPVVETKKAVASKKAGARPKTARSTARAT
jgi:hypothetical protein